MRLRKIQRGAVGLVALALLATLAPAAQATVGDEAPILPSGAVYVLPEEMRAMGEPAARIKAQEVFIASLTEEQVADQAEIRALEPAWTDVGKVVDVDLSSGETFFSTTPSLPGSNVSPLIVSRPCGNTNYYHVRFLALGGELCFQGEGTYVVSPGKSSISEIRAGRQNGRSYYRVGNGYYWTVTRGPDGTFRPISSDPYAFTYTLHRVQIFKDHTICSPGAPC